MLTLHTKTEICHAFIYVGDEYLGCENEGTHRVAGEQDSFGTEWLYFCDSDYEEFLKEMHAYRLAQRTGPCEWCKKEVTDRFEFRGFDSDGPWDKQWVCGPCRVKDGEALQEELDYLDSVNSRYDSYSDPDWLDIDYPEED